jgi:hypothetical protein
MSAGLRGECAGEFPFEDVPAYKDQVSKLALNPETQHQHHAEFEHTLGDFAVT